MARRREEHFIQTRFFNVLKIAEKRYPLLRWIHAIPNGGKRDEKTAQTLKAEGVKPGVADVFCPLRGKNGKHGLYIEFKTDYGRQSDEQNDFERAVMQEEFVYRLCRSSESGIWAIEDYLGIRILENPRPPKEEEGE